MKARLKARLKTRLKPGIQSGFTLIELMVGATIALISMVVMFQVQENWGRQQRSISSGGDSHVAGTISAFHIERDLRNAGMGFGNSSYLGCTVSAYDAQRTGTGRFTFPLAPVQIINGVAGAPDEIRVLYGNSSSLSSSYNVARTIEATTAMADSRNGVALGDLVVVSTPVSTLPVGPVAFPITCHLAEITSLTGFFAPAIADDGKSIRHDTTAYQRTSSPPATRLAAGAGQCTGAGPWNCAIRYNLAGGGLLPAGWPATGFPDTNWGVGTQGELRSLGDDPRLNAWAVNTTLSTLTLRDRLHNGIASDVSDGVVDLQAEYGLDTNADDVVDTWQGADPADWTQVRSIRFALLSRGQDYDKLAVTTNAPTWSGGAFVMRNVNNTTDSGPTNLGVNNWRNYRYNVFEVTVPLRNMIWRRFW